MYKEEKSPTSSLPKTVMEAPATDLKAPGEEERLEMATQADGRAQRNTLTRSTL